MKELKDCPFCGSKAEMFERPKGFRIECVERWGKCPMNMRTHHFFDKENAINAWNERYNEKTD